MYLPYASVWQPAWAHFFWQAAQRAKRFALPNAEVMIHQPSGGAQGQATEIQIVAEKILQTKKEIK